MGRRGRPGGVEGRLSVLVLVVMVMMTVTVMMIVMIVEMWVVVVIIIEAVMVIYNSDSCSNICRTKTERCIDTDRHTTRHK